MIEITKLNNNKFIINCEHIESIEATPDTTICMTTGKKFIAKESINDVIEMTVAYKRRIISERVINR